jgi:hypothetical protein
MEMSQINSLYSYLKQTKMSFFFFTKLENRRVEQVLFGGWFQWKVKDIETGYRRVNMVQVLCTNVCKWKNETY